MDAQARHGITRRLILAVAVILTVGSLTPGAARAQEHYVEHYVEHHVMISHAGPGDPFRRVAFRGTRDARQPCLAILGMKDNAADPRGVLTLGPVATHPLGTVIVHDGLDVSLAAFDLSPMTPRLIRDGLLDFTIDQQPDMQANPAVRLLVMASRYRMTPPDIDTGFGVVDASNVTDVKAPTRETIR